MTSKSISSESTMRPRQAIHEPLIQRLIVLFLILGLAPTVVLAAAPTIYISLHGTEALGESLLLMWAAQGVTFLVIVLLGASVVLKLLAMPIQELVNGARAIAEGDLAYRVPITHVDQSLATLAETFNAMAEAVESMRDELEEQRAALQTTLDVREREFNTILRIANLVNSQDNLHSTADRALKIARENLGTDIISLALLDESDQIASAVFACKDCSYATGTRCDQCPQQRLLRQSLHAMEDNLIQRAITQREKMRIDDIHAADSNLKPAVMQVLDRLGTRKLAIKPLITRGRVLGVLVLMRPEVKHVPERASTLLEALSENITVLLESWRLRNKSRTLTILEERRRLASELHDSVTQSLFTLSLTARGLKNSLQDVPGVNHAALDVLVEQTKVIQAEMRTLINELRPIDLETDDLENALRQHVQSLQHSTEMDVKLILRGNVRGLPKPVQQNLNRIAQEALSNVARHANAQHATIELEVTGDLVTLTITDDGCGFDPREVALCQSNCLGLLSMRERAEMLGGVLMVRSNPGTETSITARIPLGVTETP